MFERNRIDNPPEPGAVPVELTLADGTVAKGKLLVPAGKALADLLNGAGGFVEFEPYGGERRFVAKSQLASVRPVGVPRVPNLAARAREADSFDPHGVLGVPRGAAWEDIRQAYHSLAKAYHPDRYASAELPAEVIEYLYAMARRVNAAYAALEPARQIPKPAAAVRATAVYTTSARL
jgi:hypothetical protein